MKTKRIFMLLFAAAAMLTFASCNKDNSDTDTPANESATVADTEWRWGAEDPNSVAGIIDISVEFNGPKLASLTYTDMSTGIMQSDVMIGTYTYTNGKGTLNLRDDNNNTTVNASFTISGTKMTLSFKGTTYSLTKM
ncbi:MAG: hypothetical protein J6X62_04445 [Bacteroidales bacterium]|nr:hypothetical protein [Bacteroidales bacterium]